MERKPLKIVLFILCFTWVGTAVTQEKFDLKYRFDTEKPFLYKLKSNSVTQTKWGSYPPQEVQSDIEMTFSAQLDTGQSEKHFALVLTFKDADIRARTGGSSNYANTEVLKEKSITVLLDEKGRIVETIGLDLLPRIQLVATDPGGENMGVPMKELFVELSEQAVGVGDEWEMTRIDTLVEAGRTTIIKTDGKFKFKKITEKEGFRCAQINAKFKAEVVQTASGMGTDMKFEGNGKGKIELFFALEEGIIVINKMSVGISGIIELTGTQNLKGTLSDHQEMTFQLIQ